MRTWYRLLRPVTAWPARLLGDQRPRELAELYTAYELDDQRAEELQAQIVELQRLLLANHHRLQVELRTIVSRERFEFLRRRLAFVVAPADTPPQAPPPQGLPAAPNPTRTTP